MHSVHTGPVSALLMQAAVLALIAVAAPLGVVGWAAGVACGVLTSVALAYGLRRSRAHTLGPADWVTLVRACLIGAVTALVAQSFVASISVVLLVTTATIALLLDAVDGWVARRTQTSSELGALFDQEADAFLILVLSIYAAGIVGFWVVAIGAIRYVYLAGGWVLPWLTLALPRRPWRKVVAAVQGIALTIVAAGVLPWLAAEALAVMAFALLAESFGRDIWWQWRHRDLESRGGTAAQGQFLYAGVQRIESG